MELGDGAGTSAAGVTEVQCLEALLGGAEGVVEAGQVDVPPHRLDCVPGEALGVDLVGGLAGVVEPVHGRQVVPQVVEHGGVHASPPEHADPGQHRLAEQRVVEVDRLRRVPVVDEDPGVDEPVDVLEDVEAVTTGEPLEMAQVELLAEHGAPVQDGAAGSDGVVEVLTEQAGGQDVDEAVQGVARRDLLDRVGDEPCQSAGDLADVPGLPGCSGACAPLGDDLRHEPVQLDGLDTPRAGPRAAAPLCDDDHQRGGDRLAGELAQHRDRQLVPPLHVVQQEGGRTVRRQRDDAPPPLLHGPRPPSGQLLDGQVEARRLAAVDGDGLEHVELGESGPHRQSLAA